MQLCSREGRVKTGFAVEEGHQCFSKAKRISKVLQFEAPFLACAPQLSSVHTKQFKGNDQWRLGNNTIKTSSKTISNMNLQNIYTRYNKIYNNSSFYASATSDEWIHWTSQLRKHIWSSWPLWWVLLDKSIRHGCLTRSMLSQVYPTSLPISFSYYPHILWIKYQCQNLWLRTPSINFLQYELSSYSLFTWKLELCSSNYQERWKKKL
jgi:hypothetical protein